MKRFGAPHVGMGTDMYQFARTMIEHYDASVRVSDAFDRHGLSFEDVRDVLGGNDLRTLPKALTVST